MQIRIRLGNKTLSVPVSPTDDIQTVKKKIQELEAIPVNQQRLTFLGQPVLGNTPLSTIGEGSLLHFTWEDQAEIPAEAGGTASSGRETQAAELNDKASWVGNVASQNGMVFNTDLVERQLQQSTERLYQGNGASGNGMTLNGRSNVEALVALIRASSDAKQVQSNDS